MKNRSGMAVVVSLFVLGWVTAGPGCLVSTEGLIQNNTQGSSGTAGAAGDTQVGGASGFLGGDASAGQAGVAGAGMAGQGTGGSEPPDSGIGGAGGSESACAGKSECVQMPDGWKRGYVASAEESCVAGFAQDGDLVHSGELSSVAKCDCSCDSLPGKDVCRNDDVWIYRSVTGCGRVPNGYDRRLKMGCSQHPQYSDLSYWMRTYSYAAGTSKIQGVLKSTEPTWKTSHKLCVGAGSAEGCASGKECVSRVPADRKACVWKAGNSPCPNGYAQNRRVLYTKLKDERSCSPCTCEANSGQVCKMAVTAWTSNNCSTGKLQTDVVAFHQCPHIKNWDKINSYLLLGAGTYKGHLVKASSLQGTVGVDTSSAVTVCCQ